MIEQIFAPRPRAATRERTTKLNWNPTLISSDFQVGDFDQAHRGMPAKSVIAYLLQHGIHEWVPSAKNCVCESTDGHRAIEGAHSVSLIRPTRLSSLPA